MYYRRIGELYCIQANGQLPLLCDLSHKNCILNSDDFGCI
ncbi:hypothetical protein T4D_1523 [Trichinella pseudospiralis]|uniref:Uncharacterized protein n=1 Tax=Trichinella pseudospiralis TaxID=6337 RepID=A0A0V1DYC9_TRIPS|nr:hypothetical protein T4D_1523 [Trichinella pseudospiralis]